MGCHTWFYTKSYRSRDEATELAVREIDSRLSDLSIWKSDDRYWRTYYFTLRKLLIMKRDSEYINDTGMLYGQILWDLQPESGTYIPAPPVDDYRYDRDIDYHMLEDTYVENEHRGDYYIPTDRYHDVFRVSGYPGKRLFSFREVVVWLLNPLTWWRYQPSITWQGLKDTKQFFDEYPDSMITFG